MIKLFFANIWPGNVLKIWKLIATSLKYLGNLSMLFINYNKFSLNQRLGGLSL